MIKAGFDTKAWLYQCPLTVFRIRVKNFTRAAFDRDRKRKVLRIQCFSGRGRAWQCCRRGKTFDGDDLPSHVMRENKTIVRDEQNSNAQKKNEQKCKSHRRRDFFHI